jgi:hypothetical protein
MWKIARGREEKRDHTIMRGGENKSSDVAAQKARKIG